MYIWLHRAYAGALNANVWLRQRPISLCSAVAAIA